MLLREVDYARPGSVEDAVKLLAAREDARALAGGQSLVNVMKVRVAAPELVVDLNGIDVLRGVENEGGALAIGAMTTYAEIVSSAEVAAARPILAEVARTTSRSGTAGRSAATSARTTRRTTSRRCSLRSGPSSRSWGPEGSGRSGPTSSSRACSRPPSTRVSC